jgi:DNA polymerase-1
MKRTALIDADVLVYMAGLANEYEVQWDSCNWSLFAELDKSVADLEDRIEEIKTKLQCTHVVMALSSYDNPWRKIIMPSYKGKRAKLGARKPIVHAPLREYLHQEHRTYERQGLEGDDILGILVTHPTIIEGDKIVVSIDKDMNTLPGLHLNLNRARESKSDDWSPLVRTVSLAEADYYHLSQALTGDATDGYPGCPKIGPVRAEKILLDDDCGLTRWQRIVREYEKAGLSEAVALDNARVARILRHDEYNFKTKEVVLWRP